MSVLVVPRGAGIRAIPRSDICIAAWVSGARTNLANGRAATVTGQPTVAAGLPGLLVTGTTQCVELPTGPLKSSSLTLLTVATLNDVGRFNGLGAFGPAGNQNTQWSLVVDGYSSGHWQLELYDSSTSHTYPDSGQSDLVAGRTYIFAVSTQFVGNTVLYRDGVVAASTSGTDRDPGYNTDNSAIAYGYGDGVTSNYVLHAALAWDGVLSADIVAACSRDWKRLLAPEQDFVFFGAAAGGSTTVTVDAGSLTLTGQSVTNTTTGAVGAGSLNLTGQSVGVVQTIAVTPGTLSLTGQDVTAKTTVGVTAGSLTLTGSDVTVVPPSGSVSVAVDPGTLTLTGQSITGTVSIPVTKGNTTLTGQTVGVSITVPVEAGTLTLTGQSVSASVVGSTTVSVTPGTLTLTGYDVAVTYTGGTKGGAAKGKNLTLKQKKKLKAVISQEWLKAEETAKELFQERLKDAEPAKVKIEKLTEAQSLAEVIVALKALSKETVTLPEQQVVLKSINKTIVAKTEKPVEKVNTIETRLIQFEKQLANIEELILMVLAEVS